MLSFSSFSAGCEHLDTLYQTPLESSLNTSDAVGKTGFLKPHKASKHPDFYPNGVFCLDECGEDRLCWCSLSAFILKLDNVISDVLHREHH